MNREKLQDWAHISEIVGGFAVLITLIFLVLEIRENNETLKASTYDSLVADLGEWRLGNARNDSLAEILASSTRYEDLTSLEQFRLRDSIVSLFLILERAYIQWEAGNLDDRDWERFQRSICGINRQSSFEGRFGVAIDQVTTSRFQNYRKSECVGET